MPLITRRSSTRGLPLVPVGRWGAIRANCLSVSQKWSRLIGVPPQGAVNHETTRSQTALMGPGPKPTATARQGFGIDPPRPSRQRSFRTLVLRRGADRGYRGLEEVTRSPRGRILLDPTI